MYYLWLQRAVKWYKIKLRFILKELLNMSDLTLVIMAAGMGSRFGGGKVLADFAKGVSAVIVVGVNCNKG